MSTSYSGPLDHQSVLDLFLSLSCVATTEEVEGETIYTFRFDLHCVEVEVKVKLVSTFQTIQYEIVSVEMVN